MSMTEAMPVDSGQLSVIDRGQLPTASVIARVRKVREIMEAVMKEGVHFGRIPGAKKPSLYKPGAEVLMMTFHIGPTVQAEDLSTADEIRYRVKVTGVSQNTGVALGEGVGEASTNEEKYRWRSAVHPKEYDATPENLRRIKFDREGHETRQVRTSPADLANTVLLMATKRATVNMVRVVTACSDVFDQDLEDLAEELRQHTGEAAPEPKKPQRASETKSSGQKSAATGAHSFTGPVTIKAVEKRQTKAGKDIFWIKASDGNIYSTFSETDANELKTFEGSDHQVRIEYDTKEIGGKPYHNFQGVQLAEEKAAGAKPATPATSPQQPELTADDLGDFGG